MTQPSPLARSRKPKDKSLLAITLAVLLHIVIAVVIYFSMFYKTESIVTPTTKADQQPIEVVPTTTEDNNTSSLNSDKSTSPNVTITDADKEHAIVYTNDHSTSKDLNAELEPKPASKIANNPVAEQTSIAKSNDNSITTVDSTSDSRVNQSEYQLKQTQEYQQLDADIDKDSEQLSTLINEIKQRNQSQIQQHHATKTAPEPLNNSTAMQYEYPITPIKSQ